MSYDHMKRPSNVESVDAFRSSWSDDHPETRSQSQSLSVTPRSDLPESIPSSPSSPSSHSLFSSTYGPQISPYGSTISYPTPTSHSTSDSVSTTRSTLGSVNFKTSIGTDFGRISSATTESVKQKTYSDRSHSFPSEGFSWKKSSKRHSGSSVKGAELESSVPEDLIGTEPDDQDEEVESEEHRRPPLSVTVPQTPISGNFRQGASWGQLPGLSVLGGLASSLDPMSDGTRMDHMKVQNSPSTVQSGSSSILISPDTLKQDSGRGNSRGRRSSTPSLTSRQRESLPSFSSPFSQSQSGPLWAGLVYGPIGSSVQSSPGSRRPSLLATSTTSAPASSHPSPRHGRLSEEGFPSDQSPSATAVTSQSIWGPINSSTSQNLTPTAKILTPTASPRAMHTSPPHTSSPHPVSLHTTPPHTSSSLPISTSTVYSAQSASKPLSSDTFSTQSIPQSEDKTQPLPELSSLQLEDNDRRRVLKRSSSDGEILSLVWSKEALKERKHLLAASLKSRSSSISSNESAASILSEGAMPRTTDSLFASVGLTLGLSSTSRSQSNPSSRGSTSPRGPSFSPQRRAPGSDSGSRDLKARVPVSPRSGGSGTSRNMMNRVTYVHMGRTPLDFPRQSPTSINGKTPLQTHEEEPSDSDSEHDRGSPLRDRTTQADSNPEEDREEFSHSQTDTGSTSEGSSSIPPLDRRQRRPSHFGVATQALKALNPLRAYYDISWSKLGSLSTEIRHDLYRETCPLCLSVGLSVGEDESSDSQSSLNPSDDMACVVLRCKRLGCHHVAHALCVNNDPVRTLQRLQRAHPTSFFKALPSTPTTSVIASLEMDYDGSRRLQPGIRSNCVFEVAFLHMTSDTCILNWRCPAIVSPTSPVSATAIRSFVNPQNGLEYLYVDLGREESARMPFQVSRGRILFQCTSHSTNEIWRYQANFDLDAFGQPSSPSSPKAPVTGPTDLVLVDSAQGATLTITVIPLHQPDKPGKEKDEKAQDFEKERSNLSRSWAISGIRLEISSVVPPAGSVSHSIPRQDYPGITEVPAYVISPTHQLPQGSFFPGIGVPTPRHPAQSGEPYVYITPEMHAPPHADPSFRHDVPSGSPEILTSTPIIRVPSYEMYRQIPTSHPSKEYPQYGIPTDPTSERGRGWNSSGKPPVLKQPRAMFEQPDVSGGQTEYGFAQLDPEHSKESIMDLARSQVGSRFLQRKLSEHDPTYFNTVFAAVYPHLAELMVDLFGNYLCQKLIEFANEEQRYNMLTVVSPHVVAISCDRQGTRAFQKMVEAAKSDRERRLIIQSLSGTAPIKNKKNKTSTSQSKLLQLIRDPNGSHVIHAILDHFPMELLGSIFDVAFKSARQLGVDQHGLCVLKKCMTLADPETFVSFSIKLLEHVLDFVNNQYGNYLIQHVIERVNGYGGMSALQPGGPVTTKQGQKPLPLEPEVLDSKTKALYQTCIDQLHRGLKGHYPRLSQQKFSSNVVEKCLRVGDPVLRSAIISELMEEGTISSLLQDSFGNYVMQNVLYVANEEQKRLLIQRIQPDLHSLRKNIRKKWERLLSSSLSSLPSTLSAPSSPSSLSSSPSSASPVPLLRHEFDGSTSTTEGLSKLDQKGSHSSLLELSSGTDSEDSTGGKSKSKTKKNSKTKTATYPGRSRNSQITISQGPIPHTTVPSVPMRSVMIPTHPHLPPTHFSGRPGESVSSFPIPISVPLPVPLPLPLPIQSFPQQRPPTSHRAPPPSATYRYPSMPTQQSTLPTQSRKPESEPPVSYWQSAGGSRSQQPSPSPSPRHPVSGTGPQSHTSRSAPVSPTGLGDGSSSGTPGSSGPGIIPFTPRGTMYSSYSGPLLPRMGPSTHPRTPFSPPPYF